MLPAEICDSLLRRLEEQYREPVTLSSVKPVSGGSINNAFHIRCNIGDFFLKYNYSDSFPGMFKAEAEGLKTLESCRCIRIPQVIHWADTGVLSYLLLEYLHPGHPSGDFWETFGRKIAQLHHHTSPHFGFSSDNYIGSLKQLNDRHETWSSFLIKQRLQPMAEQAYTNGLMKTQDLKWLELLYKRLPDLYPEEPPSLLHGDLWSGNFLSAHDGTPCLIDPAVYYGHRETYIAMTSLFGGFSKVFYDAYNHHYPLESGWKSRTSLGQLYPLLVHVNLFGEGYMGQVRQVLKQYV